MKADVRPEARALLGRGRIHPALHLDEGGVVLGRATSAGEYRIMTVLQATAFNALLMLAPTPAVPTASSTSSGPRSCSTR